MPFVSNSGLAVYIRQQPKRDPARKIASALLSVYGGGGFRAWDNTLHPTQLTTAGLAHPLWLAHSGLES